MDCVPARVLALQIEDLKLADAQLHVLGKGRKARTLPLPGEIRDVLQSYLRVERPLTNSPLSVRFPEGPPPGSADDARGTSLAVPPSSMAQRGPGREPPSISTYFRSGYGAGGHLPTCSPAPDGAFTDSHHEALCPTCAAGRLARICARHRKPCAFDLPAGAMNQSKRSLEEIFETQVQTLALTLQPFTVAKYPYVARHFVRYLRATFPKVRRLSQLRRHPHMLGWFRWLCELRPPVGNHTREQRLLCLRRRLDDWALQGHPL